MNGGEGERGREGRGGGRREGDGGERLIYLNHVEFTFGNACRLAIVDFDCRSFGPRGDAEVEGKGYSRFDRKRQRFAERVLGSEIYDNLQDVKEGDKKREGGEKKEGRWI